METKEEIISELVSWNKILNKSPGRRVIPLKLYKDCLKQFGSFNNAKIAAGLKIFKRKADILKFESTILTKELVRIVAYITGDGHLHKDLKGFLHSSKDINSLKDFEYCVKKQFGIDVSKIQEASEDSWGEGTQYRYFNTTIAKFLYSIGTAKGDKVDQAFGIPFWIRADRLFIKEYLKILYYCEGSKARDNKNIKINMRKTEDFVREGIIYMKSLKEALEDYFEIETSRVYTAQGKKRNKDNKDTKDIIVLIKRTSVDDFIKNVGWIK